MRTVAITRKPGRPRAIPDDLVEVTRDLLRQGRGYKSAARILRDDYGLSLDWTRVRDLAKKKGAYASLEFTTGVDSD